jgi:NADP-dependent 3-hydroxy acid dehydrogenase YdfG
VAIVTGAGRGIGRAVARALADEGASVVLASRTRRELAELAATIRESGGRALAFPTDVASADSVDALVEQSVAELGRVDVLVTAAGVASFGPLAATKPGDWEAMLAVNLRGAMLCCRAVLPPMLRQRRGTIINVSSIAARRSIPGCAVYAATKAGISAFSRVLAEEVRGDGIRVGLLVPGAVDTPLWDAIPNGPDRGRMLRAEDVARAVVFMATLPAHAALEEVTLLPAGGIL